MSDHCLDSRNFNIGPLIGLEKSVVIQPSFDQVTTSESPRFELKVQYFASRTQLCFKENGFNRIVSLLCPHG
jgi:hypothetical protein